LTDFSVGASPKRHWMADWGSRLAAWRCSSGASEDVRPSPPNCLHRANSCPSGREKPPGGRLGRWRRLRKLPDLVASTFADLIAEPHRTSELRTSLSRSVVEMGVRYDERASPA